MTAFEYGSDIILVDCGMTFPAADLFGVDAVLPDFSYVAENADRVRALLITHAHEDHIGGVSYLLQQVNVPVYGSPLALGFIKNRLKEKKINNAKLVEIQPGEILKFGCFSVEPVHMTHSVADAYSFAIRTPVGLIFHTGDFKVDYTPVDGDPIDLARLANIGDEGVLLLMADSTNAHREGYSRSELEVGRSLESIFRESPSRIIITTFSSHVHRVQTILNLAAQYGRKVAVNGRSMENMVKLASELGYLDIPANTVITLKQSKQFKPSELVLLTTGSQGEPRSALTRIVAGQHKDIKILKDDVVVLSSSTVPGNDLNVNQIVNTVMEKGAKVYYSDVADVHTSGHAYREELKLLHALLRPQYFMPIHGEVRLLVSHADLARQMGMSDQRILLADNGDVIEVSKGKVKKSSEHVPADPVLIDTNGAFGVDSRILSERKVLSETGIIVLTCVFDASSQLLLDLDIRSKGYLNDNELGSVLKEALRILDERISQTDFSSLSPEAAEKFLSDTLRGFLNKRMNRSPVIVPVFMEV